MKDHATVRDDQREGHNGGEDRAGSDGTATKGEWGPGREGLPAQLGSGRGRGTSASR
jgi:hypothetical protein